MGKVELVRRREWCDEIDEEFENGLWPMAPATFEAKYINDEDCLAGPAAFWFKDRGYSGQVLVAGEPTCVQDPETGEWITSYPFIWCPAPPTHAYSFGDGCGVGVADWKPFVQEATG